MQQGTERFTRFSRRAVAKAVIVGAIGAGSTRDAVAQAPRTVALQVSGDQPDDCPDATALMEEVRRRIGREGFADGSARQITVRFNRGGRTRRAARLVLREVGERDAARTIVQPGPTCAGLADAVALAVALLIDPDAAMRSPPPTPPTPAPVCPVVECPTCAVCPLPPPPLPIAPPAPRPAPASPAPPIWVRLTGGSSYGLDPWPSIATGLSLDVGISRRWGLQVGALLVPTHASTDGIVGVGRTFGRLGACYDWTPGPLRLGLCAGGMAGAVHLSALALQPVDPGDRFWAGLWLDGHVHVALGRFLALGLHGRGVVPVLSWTARVEGRQEPSFEPSAVAFEGELTLGVRLR